MTKPTTELTALQVTEGSLVDKGDNPEAHVKLTKSAAGEGLFTRLKKWAAEKMVRKDGMEDAGPVTTAQVMARDAFQVQFHKLKCALMESVNSFLASPPSPDMVEGMLKSVQEFSDAYQVALGGSGLAKSADVAHLVDSLKEALEAELQGTTEKRALFVEAVQKMDALETPHSTVAVQEQQDMNINDVLKNLPTAQRAVVEEALKMGAKTMSEEEKKKMEDEKAMHMKKDMESAVTKAVEAATAEMTKRFNEAQDRVAKLEDEKATATFVAKAVEMKIPGQDVNALGAMLKTSYGVSEAHGKQVEATVSALAKQAQAGLQVMTRTIGKTSTGTSGSVQEEVTQKASELRKAQPTLTPEQAYRDVLQADPDLYTRLRAEQV